MCERERAGMSGERVGVSPFFLSFLLSYARSLFLHFFATHKHIHIHIHIHTRDPTPFVHLSFFPSPSSSSLSFSPHFSIFCTRAHRTSFALRLSLSSKLLNSALFSPPNSQLQPPLSHTLSPLLVGRTNIASR